MFECLILLTHLLSELLHFRGHFLFILFCGFILKIGNKVNLTQYGFNVFLLTLVNVDEEDVISFLFYKN